MRIHHRSALLHLLLILSLVVTFGLAADEPTEEKTEEKAVETAEEAAKPSTFDEIKAETIPAMTAVVLSMSGSFAQHGEAIGKLMMYTGMSSFQMTGGPFGIYLNSPKEVAEDSLLWEVCVPVSGVTNVEKPYELREMPEMLAAYLVCTGPFGKSDPCYGALFEWIGKNGYEIAGPMQEHWLTDARTTPAEENQTKIVVPVVKK